MTDTVPLTIAFRVDGNHAMGLGHLMRCRALAEALIAAGHRCSFLVAAPDPEVTAPLKAAGIAILAIDPARDRDAAETLTQCRALGAAALVIDGYHFEDGWRRAARAVATPIVAFADGPLRPGHADLLIDAASPESSDPSELFGPDYVLLRRELVEAARLPLLPIEQRPTILITFGGSDPLALTHRVTISLFGLLPDTQLAVVIGPATEGGDAVARSLRALGRRVTVHRAPPAMGELMRHAGLAVSAAGGTVGELAALGVPAVLAVVADNQLAGAQACVAAGWCSGVDARTDPAASNRLALAAVHLWLHPEKRALWAARARSAVDPGGADRVAAALLAAIARRKAGN